MDTLISNNATAEEITTWVALACVVAGFLLGFIVVILETKTTDND